jgi:hypothetical protein
MAFVSSQQGPLDVLAAAIANVLNTSVPAHTTIKLAQAPFAPAPTSDPTTFTEATFDGYASKTISAWEAPYLSAGAAKTNGTAVESWIPTGTTTPNTIAGYWLVAGNGDYLGGEVFATPINVVGPTTPVNLVPAYTVMPPVFTATVIP